MTSVSTPVGRYPQESLGVSASGGQGENLKQAAQGFEAVFLRQILSAASKADFGGEKLFGSSSEQTFREMRDARFAEIASAQGSIGLASAIEAQLARQLDLEG